MRICKFLIFLQIFSYFLQCDCPRECNSCTYKNGKCDCNSCKKGFYGMNCKEKCNEKCGNGCSSYFGLCYGCIKGYTGFYCKNTCEQKCIYGCKQTNKGNCYSNEHCSFLPNNNLELIDEGEGEVHSFETEELEVYQVL